MEENKTITEMETTTIAEETNSEIFTEDTTENAAETQNVPEEHTTEAPSDAKADDSVSDSSAEETAEGEKKIIDLSNGEADNKPVSKKANLDPPETKKKDIDYDIFVPKIKQLKGRNIESFSDEEIIALALNKLTCDSYKSLKGVENSPAIACWNHLYDVVGDGDLKLAKAICNLKKDFPGAMKYMMEQVKKIGSGGFEHNELFEFVEKYYFTKEKPKKDAKSEGAKPVKTDVKPSSASVPAPSRAKEKKQSTPKAKAKEKPFTAKAEKKEEPLQLSLLM